MEYDVQQIAKYLQGKAFKEIKSILTKVTKGKPSEDLLLRRFDKGDCGPLIVAASVEI